MVEVMVEGGDGDQHRQAAAPCGGPILPMASVAQRPPDSLTVDLRNVILLVLKHRGAIVLLTNPL